VPETLQPSDVCVVMEFPTCSLMPSSMSISPLLGQLSPRVQLRGGVSRERARWGARWECLQCRPGSAACRHVAEVEDEESVGEHLLRLQTNALSTIGRNVGVVYANVDIVVSCTDDAL